MIFFGGFGFDDNLEFFKHIFKAYNISKCNYDVCGFSFGAQKALDFAYDSKNRINRLILFSPAFFNNKDSAFVDSQILSFKKNKDVYLKYFLKNIGFTNEISGFRKDSNLKDLTQLLNYNFDKNKLECIQNRGTSIMVFLGEFDKIVDSNVALEFFKDFGIVYFLKNTNHLLRQNNLSRN